MKNLLKLKLKFGPRELRTSKKNRYFNSLLTVTSYNYFAATSFGIYNFQNPKGAHSHILLTGKGGGHFFGSAILAKRDLFGSMKDAGTFGGHEKKQGYFWVLYFLSAQTNININAIYCWCGIFLGYAKKT